MVASVVGKVSQALGGKVTSALGSTGLGSAISALMRDDPEAPYHFSLQIDGVLSAHCKEVGGLKMTIETEPAVREGGNNLHPHVMLKGIKWEPLVLKRGFFGQDTDMYNWMRQMMDESKFTGGGMREGKNVELVVFNDSFSEKCRFEFYRAFPIEFSGPTLDAGKKGEIAFEEIKIHYDYFEFTAGSKVTELLGGLASAALNAI
jgi:phage tail-like protein